MKVVATRQKLPAHQLFLVDEDQILAADALDALRSGRDGRTGFSSNAIGASFEPAIQDSTQAAIAAAKALCAATYTQFSRAA